LTHSTDTEAELDLLHPADRLMVGLIQLPHLSDRVHGMLFQVGFAQNRDLLQQVRRIFRAAADGRAWSF
jgi:cytokinesis protein